MEGKHCTKCGEWVLLEGFHKRKTASDGRKSRCKECARIDKGAKKRAKRKELLEFNGVLGKECCICDEWKPLDVFAVKEKGLGGRRSDCIDCERKRNLQYFYDHREERRLYNIEYNKNNREKLNDKLRKWYQENPDKVVINNNRRRARKAALPDNFSNEDMHNIYAMYGGCALTGDTESIQWDHVIPIATGCVGTIASNMIPLRADLNSSKNDANIFEWFQRNKTRYQLDQEKFDNLIMNLARMCGMSVDDYRFFVYRCFENKEEVC